MNEYQKKTEFFDENRDKAHKENHGAYEEKQAVASGKSDSGGHQNAEHNGKHFETRGKFEKGRESQSEAGHKDDQAKDQFHKNLEEFGNSYKDDGFKTFGQTY